VASGRAKATPGRCQAPMPSCGLAADVACGSQPPLDAQFLAEGVPAFTVHAMALDVCAIDGERPLEERQRDYLQAWRHPEPPEGPRTAPDVGRSRANAAAPSVKPSATPTAPVCDRPRRGLALCVRRRPGMDAQGQRQRTALRTVPHRATHLFMQQRMADGRICAIDLPPVHGDTPRETKASP
jgi:hypothetical protein